MHFLPGIILGSISVSLSHITGFSLEEIGSVILVSLSFSLLTLLQELERQVIPRGYPILERPD